MFALPKRFAIGGMDGLEESISRRLEKSEQAEDAATSPQVFFKRGFDRHEFTLYPVDPEQDYRFKLVVSVNFDAGAFAIVLEGAISNGPMQAIGRYDVHDNEHPNCRKCCPVPPLISPGAFHVHRYNVCCLDRGDTWDKCASYLPGFNQNGRLSRNVSALIGGFLEASHTSFAGGDSQERLFATGQP